MQEPTERPTAWVMTRVRERSAVILALALVGCGTAATGPAGTAGRSPRPAAAGASASVAASAGSAAAAGAPGGPAGSTASAAPTSAPLTPAARERVERFCSACHPLPASENFPRAQWPAEVRLGFELYRASLRSDLPEPPEAEAIRYFQEHAPEALAVPRAADRAERPSPVHFEPVIVRGMPTQSGPAVAQVLVHRAPGGDATGAGIVTADMRSGEIRRWRLAGDAAASGVLCRSGHPCRLTPVPGRADAWFVGDLGSYMPEDHDFGAVGVLEGNVGASDRQPGGDENAVAGTLRTLRDGLSRVVEAIPVEFDGEAPLDLLVLEFGWRRTGALRVLLGAGEGAVPSGQRVLDPRHGCLAARVVDLDGDGFDDVVATFAQEHETVDVWYRRGPGDFEHRQIHRLPDPSWGSSGLDVADIDGDGDQDIVHFNGDTMDSGLPRPTHGIRVLRNDGGRSFECVDIAPLAGVSQASAADVDGDGDLDVVACALLPPDGRRSSGSFDALVWIEQAPDGWRPHSIERDACDHAAFALADVDGDGRTDVVAGVFQADAGAGPTPLLRVWLNRPSAR